MTTVAEALADFALLQLPLPCSGAGHPPVVGELFQPSVFDGIRSFSFETPRLSGFGFQRFRNCTILRGPVSDCGADDVLPTSPTENKFFGGMSELPPMQRMRRDVEAPLEAEQAPRI